MKLNLITLATVKAQLGIATSDYDTSITAMIPIVSNDIRRILNTNFDKEHIVTLTSGSNEFSYSGGAGSFNDRVYKSVFNMGQVVYSPALPDDTYIQSYDPTTATFTLSASATADGTYLYETLNISQWPTIAKMIFYKLGKQSTDSATEQKLKSIAYGNVNKTFADSEINKIYDYPQVFIDDLGVPFAHIG